MTCKDCIHYEACKDKFAGLYKIRVDEPEKHLELNPNVENVCSHFKDKSRIIELPCKVGDMVYRIIPKCSPSVFECPFNGGYGNSRCNGVHKRCNAYIEEEEFDYSHIKCIGKTVFINQEEAEAKLKELKGDE